MKIHTGAAVIWVTLSLTCDCGNELLLDTKAGERVSKVTLTRRAKEQGWKFSLDDCTAACPKCLKTGETP